MTPSIYRSFDGIRFTSVYPEGTRSKREAEETKNLLKYEGYRVRIIRNSGGTYFVYAAKKPKTPRRGS